MNIRPKSAQNQGKSQFQRNFETKQTFKRNKHYINLQDLNNIEKQYELRRRKPIKSQDEQVNKKISESFVVSTAQLTQRIGRSSSRNQHRSQIASFSVIQPSSSRQIRNKKFSLSQINPSQSYLQSDNIPERPQKNSRSFSMDKMTSRQYHHKLRNKPVADQRLFNNFKQMQINVPLHCDFKKIPGKVLNNQIKHLNVDIEYDTQKLYQQYYYNKQVVKVDYKSERKGQNNRIFFKSQRPQNLPSTDLEPSKVDNGRKIASNFKGSNITQNSQLQFYRDSGKQLPSQIDQRTMNELTNFWKEPIVQTDSIISQRSALMRRSKLSNDQKKKKKYSVVNKTAWDQHQTYVNHPNNNKIKRPTLDYEQKKMKQDMKQSRQQKIANTKKPHIQRQQICKEKYFRYYQ